MSRIDPQSFRHYFSQRVTAVDPHSCSSHRSAAVLILIYPGVRELELVLTRRSEHLPNHAGQISFPGGSMERGDHSLVATALREAREEIGLDTRALEVLGCLEAMHLPSGFCVTPVVALQARAPRLRADPAEVDAIFTVPLSLVLDESLYQRGSGVRNGIKREFYFFDFKNYYIWGATAHILRTLAREMRPHLSKP